MSKLIALSFVAVLASCTTAPTTSTDGDDVAIDNEATKTTYTEMEEYLYENDGASYDKLQAIKATLIQNFNDICGDTFCGGDYSNLTSLSFRCSITVKTKKVHACSWVFAGSYETVTATTGTVVVNAKTFNCKIPVGNTTVATFISTLAAPATNESTEAIHRALPGATSTIYDSLGGCL